LIENSKYLSEILSRPYISLRKLYAFIPTLTPK
jgi:hypothetical protein